jgi:hypothetical protein
MALAARMIDASVWAWRCAALGVAFAIAGCGETVNNSLFDQLAASPRVPMAERASYIVPKASEVSGRWTLTMPGTGTCDVTFSDGAVTPEGNCPGKFAASRKWVIEPNGVVIRDQAGQALAQLRMAEPGRLEGQTMEGEQVLLAR